MKTLVSEQKSGDESQNGRQPVSVHTTFSRHRTSGMVKRNISLVTKHVVWTETCRLPFFLDSSPLLGRQFLEHTTIFCEEDDYA
jgi:hypothetical protein